MTEESLFERALNTPEAVREALLERECSGNSALLARVKALLPAHLASDNFLSPATIDSEEAGEGAANSPKRTQTIRDNTGAVGEFIAGKYKLLQRIGEGGMGSAWMADQVEPVKRRVAVKKAAWDDYPDICFAAPFRWIPSVNRVNPDRVQRWVAADITPGNAGQAILERLSSTFKYFRWSRPGLYGSFEELTAL